MCSYSFIWTRTTPCQYREVRRDHARCALTLFVYFHGPFAESIPAPVCQHSPSLVRILDAYDAPSCRAVRRDQAADALRSGLKSVQVRTHLLHHSNGKSAVLLRSLDPRARLPALAIAHSAFARARARARSASRRIKMAGAYPLRLPHPRVVVRAFLNPKFPLVLTGPFAFSHPRILTILHKYSTHSTDRLPRPRVNSSPSVLALPSPSTLRYAAKFVGARLRRSFVHVREGRRAGE